jgi:hypothetical protein
MARPKSITITGVTSGNASTGYNISNAINASFTVTVASIGTNVVLRAEYSLNGGTTWTNCNAADLTITANGQYVIPILTNNVSVPLVRFNWVSTSTGTPTVAPTLRYNI